MPVRSLLVALACLVSGCALWREPVAVAPAPRAAPAPAIVAVSTPAPAAPTQPAPLPPQTLAPLEPERFACLDGAKLQARYAPDRASLRLSVNGAADRAFARVERAHFLEYRAGAEHFLRAGPQALLRREEETVTVRAGDTLGAIALRHFGDRAYAAEIAAANAETIANPDLIHPGQRLRLPGQERRCRRVLV